MQICDLLLNLRLHLFRCAQIPEAAERIHIKWKIVELILVNSYRRIYIIIKIGQLIDIFPDFRVTRMENMCAIFMHLDSIDILRINVTADVIPFINDKTSFSFFCHL